MNCKITQQYIEMLIEGYSEKIVLESIKKCLSNRYKIAKPWKSKELLKLCFELECA